MKQITMLILAAATFVAGCGPQTITSEDGSPLQAWIDAPLDGSALPVAAYTIIFSGASFGDPIGNFEVFVNGVQEGTVPPMYQNNEGDAQYSYAEFDWLPPAPGNYLIQVRALTGEMVSAFAEANVLVGELVTSDEELPPVAGEDVLIAIPSQNANCREGNSNQFDISDTLFMGMEYMPNARGFDNLWVLFTGPATGVQCWVFIENLDLFLNEQLIEIVDVPESILPFAGYPLFPTPTPTATFTPEPVPQCSDGIDNDGDGLIDYRVSATGAHVGDRECTSPTDDDESR